MSDAYVVMEAGAERPGVENVMRKCLVAIQNASLEAEVIDEKFREHSEDLAGFVLKVSGAVAYDALASMMANLHGSHPEGIVIQLLKEATDVAVNPSELQVAYFRKQLAVDSKFVVHVNSCVKLTHSATGTVARSTCRRSQAANYKEALALMQSLLATRRDT